MYLLVFDDFSHNVTEFINEQEKLMAENGLLIIFDVSDPSNVTAFGAGEWHPAPKE